MTTYSLSWVSMLWKRIMLPSCWLMWVKLEVWLVVQKWCLKGMKWSSLVCLVPHPSLWLPIPVLLNQFLSPYFLIIFHFYNLVNLHPEYEGSMSQAWLHGVTIQSTVWIFTMSRVKCCHNSTLEPQLFICQKGESCMFINEYYDCQFHIRHNSTPLFNVTLRGEMHCSRQQI